MFKINELLKAAGGSLIQGHSAKELSGISIDSRTIRPGEGFIAVKGNNFDGHDFIAEAIRKGARAIIRRGHPSLSYPKGVAVILVKDTLKALTDIARFHRNKFDIPVVAVTGSNGKTTTKDMISRVLAEKFNILKSEGTKNNRIGLSLALLKLNKEHKIAVLELGTNHFGEIEHLTKVASPNIAVITNIGPAHLEFLGDLNGVFREKYTLVKNLKSPHIAILNRDDKLLEKEILKKSRKPFVLGFGIERKGDFSASGIKDSLGRINFRVNKKYKFTLNTLGDYNIYNALAAIAAGRLFSMSYKDIAKSLSGFTFPKSRLNLVELNRVKFIDDTYNANPFSLAQALIALDKLDVKGRKIVVMGDMLELGSREETFHSKAGRQIQRVCDCFISVGRLSKLAAESAKNFGLRPSRIFSCAKPRQARDILFKRLGATEGDVVLVKGSRAMKMEQVFT